MASSLLLLFLPLCLGLALEPYNVSPSPSPVSSSSASSSPSHVSPSISPVSTSPSPVSASPSPVSTSPSHVSASPYSFTLDSWTHQLHTTWELRGTSVSQFCAFGDFSLVELGFTGKEQDLSSGHSWAVQCMEQELGDKMVVEVDVTKYRVQPFKSYKVCLSLEDPTMGSLPRTCTHLFSFERAVPYIPEEKEEEEEEEGVEEEVEVREVVKKVLKEVQGKLETLSEVVGNVSEERELWRALEDTRNFVRDDFSKVERALHGEEEQNRHGQAGEGEQKRHRYSGEEKQKRHEHSGGEEQKRHEHSAAVSLTLPVITLIFTLCL